MTSLHIAFAAFIFSGVVLMPLGLDQQRQHQQWRTVGQMAAFFAVVACTHILRFVL